MRLVVVGDSHGDAAFVKKALRLAAANGATEVVQVGDFGVWPGHGGQRFLNTVNDIANEVGLTLTFLAGNHDDYDQLNDLKQPAVGEFSYIHPNLRWTGRINHWTWDGLAFGAAGGGVSIDKAHRTIGQSWWPDETLLESEIQTIEDRWPRLDVLFTHDCPTMAPFRHYLKDDPESHIHRQMVTRIGYAVEPTVWFHGHMHNHYEYQFFNGRVYGLECNDGAMPYYIPGWDRSKAFNVVMLDTDNMSVVPLR